MKKISIFVWILFIYILIINPVCADIILVNSSNDQSALYQGNAIWSTVRNANGNLAYYNLTTTTYWYATASPGTANNYIFNRRVMVTFPKPNSLKYATISCATVNIYGGGVKYNALGDYGASLIDANPIFPDLSNYQRTSFIEQAPNITYSNYNTSGWNQFVLSATGISRLSESNDTVSYLLVTLNDAQNITPTWAAGGFGGYSTFPTNNSAHKPYLNITYTPEATAPPKASFTSNFASGIVSVPILFNDTSIGVPTAWNWSFGDGLFSNIQNPTHTFSTGVYTISENVSNSLGYSIINKTYNITGYPLPMSYMSNAESPLYITTYDGSNQPIHPSIIYNSSGWNGFKYIMAYTPYPGGSASYENPSIRYSNDGIGWGSISGQPDPIVSAPAPVLGNTSYNNDPNVVLLPNGTLYLFYGVYWHPGGNYSITDSYYNFTTTRDGITWTQPVKTNLPPIRSASFLYDESEGWQCWGHPVYTYNLTYYSPTSANNPINWNPIGIENNVDTSTKYQWHSEVKKYNGEYMLLLLDQETLTTGSDTRGLRFYTSNNKVTWMPENNNNRVLTSTGVTTSWDYKLYKASFVEINNRYRVWYGGYNSSPTRWKIGYTESNPPLSIISQFVPTNTTNLLYPNAVSFIDTSIGFPTAWNWSYKINGTGTQIPFSTIQNPTFTPPSVGNFTIHLNASTATAYSNSAQITWVNVSPNVTQQFQYPIYEWCGIQNLYFSDVDSDVDGYGSLLNYATGGNEVDENVTVTAADGLKYIDGYISPMGLPNRSTLYSGSRTYNLYGYVDSLSSPSYFTINVSVYVNGSYSTIYNITSSPISSLTPKLDQTIYVGTRNTTLNQTDRILIQFYAYTTKVSATKIHFATGGTVSNSYVTSGYFACPAPIFTIPTTTTPEPVYSIPNMPVAKKQPWKLSDIPWWGWGVIAFLLLLFIGMRRRR